MMVNSFGPVFGIMRFAMVFNVLFWIVVLIVAVWVVTKLVRKHEHPYTNHDSHEGDNRALQILKERYARGEIDTETYQRMREELRK